MSPASTSAVVAAQAAHPLACTRAVLTRGYYALCREAANRLGGVAQRMCCDFLAPPRPQWSVQARGQRDDNARRPAVDRTVGSAPTARARHRTLRAGHAGSAPGARAHVASLKRCCMDAQARIALPRHLARLFLARSNTPSRGHALIGRMAAASQQGTSVRPCGSSAPDSPCETRASPSDPRLRSARCRRPLAMVAPACSTSGRGAGALLRVALLSLASVHAVRAAAEPPLIAGGEQFSDRGCTLAQFYNGTTGQCECLEGLVIIECAGPDQGKCGRFNGALPCLPGRMRGHKPPLSRAPACSKARAVLLAAEAGSDVPCAARWRRQVSQAHLGAPDPWAHATAM